MIIDTLDQRHKYSKDPALSQMLEAIAALDPASEPGTAVDLGDVGHLSVGTFTSKDPSEQVRFEAHRKYADIHVVLSGAERIDVAALNELQEVTPFDQDSDINFHEGDPTVTITLRPGWFAVFYPTDAHRPGTWVDGPAPVVKIVGKLRVG
ncbi:MAG: YhcH/YjgK/YiaL family protein [Propionibacteriaceae bacterium]|nr:YhcH/YjgK/YiaL family protein [Propionibacteriaceae bacterium]